jgi:hypothetical protein
MLTREQTIKAIKELKANEWVALGGMSPEAQEFAREHKDEAIWFYKNSQGNWHDWLNGIYAVSYQIYRLDSSYQLPEIESDYAEFNVMFSGNLEWQKNCLGYFTPDRAKFWDINLPEYELKYKNHVYRFEGYKFEGSEMTYSHYHGWQLPQPLLHKDSEQLVQTDNLAGSSYKKVFASKVVYRKVG